MKYASNIQFEVDVKGLKTRANLCEWQLSANASMVYRKVLQGQFCKQYQYELWDRSPRIHCFDHHMRMEYHFKVGLKLSLL